MEIMHYLAQAPNWLASKFTRKPSEPNSVELLDVQINGRVFQLEDRVLGLTTSTRDLFFDVHEMLTEVAMENRQLKYRIEKLERYTGFIPPDDDTPKPAAIPAPEKPKLQLVYDHNTHSVVHDVDKPLSPALQIGTAIAAQALQESNARQAATSVPNNGDVA